MYETHTELPPPYVIGLPERYQEWRPNQAEAAELPTNCDKRFVLISAPTGFGKSLVYVANALLSSGRTCVLTSTKGLQDQLVRDFESVGLTDVRGMGSYPCAASVHFALPLSTSCGDAPCHAGGACSLKNNGCLYYDAYRSANRASIVVTNYAYYMHINRYGEGIGEFDTLILDEAHDAPDAVGDFVGVSLDTGDLGNLLDDGRTPEPIAGIAAWRNWAQAKAISCESRRNGLQERIQRSMLRGAPVHWSMLKQLGRLKHLQRSLDTIATASGDWVIDRQRHNIVRLDPVWPGTYTERYLFRGIKKIVMFSATLRPKTAQLLGIPIGKFHFVEYPSSFPADRRPVYHVPTASIKHDSTEDEMKTWVTRIDQIVRQRTDRKAIIHTSSYARRDLLISNTEYRQIMRWHAADTTAEIVERFKKGVSPLILCSPSVSTGWDFPYTQCEYQIIAKVPFPDFTSALAKARDKLDPEWSKYITAQTLVQECGRGMRSADDRCETLIVDDNILWLVRRNREFFPKWWLDAYIPVRTIPLPPPKLEHHHLDPQAGV